MLHRPPPSAFPRWAPSGSGWSGELLRPVLPAHITSLRHPTLTNPPPNPVPPIRVHASRSTGSPELLRVPIQLGEQQQRWRPKPLPLSWTSKLPCSLRDNRILTAYSSGTGYSKLGTGTTEDFSPGHVKTDVSQGSPETTRPPSSSPPP